MKWLKHMTATWDDERVARLVDKGGMEGLGMYGLYWRVQEIIASQMEGKEPHCSVRYTVTRWSLLLSLRGSLVFSALSRLAVTGLVTVTRDGNEILVTNRNLLKYRDEYARKSGHSTENVPPRTEGEGEGEQNKKEKQKEPIARSVPPEELAGTLPLVDGSDYQVSKTQVKEWVRAYPGVDVKAELLKFKAWLNANPTLKKTHRGIARAIVSWLSRAQDSARRPIGEMKKNGRVEQNQSAFETAAANFLGRAENAGGDGEAGGDDFLPRGGGQSEIFGTDGGKTIEGES